MFPLHLLVAVPLTAGFAIVEGIGASVVFRATASARRFLGVLHFPGFVHRHLLVELGKNGDESAVFSDTLRMKTFVLVSFFERLTLCVSVGQMTL